jgi:CheY-like chemotaxis protein
MPGMTGLEMLPKVREMRPDVPIIMITAYGDPETRRKAIEGGATGLLTKPMTSRYFVRKSTHGWNGPVERPVS